MLINHIIREACRDAVNDEMPPGSGTASISRFITVIGHSKMHKSYIELNGAYLFCDM